MRLRGSTLFQPELLIYGTLLLAIGLASRLLISRWLDFYSLTQRHSHVW